MDNNSDGGRAAALGKRGSAMPLPQRPWLIPYELRGGGEARAFRVVQVQAKDHYFPA